MKPVSLQLYSVREYAKKDFLETLEKVADIGYVGIEPAGLHGHDAQEIRKVMDDLGLIASSAHVGLKLLEEDINQQVEIAQTLGYNNIVIPGAGGKESWSDADHVIKTARQCEAIAQTLKDRGLRTSYHNHAKEMVSIGDKYALEFFYENAPTIFPQIDIYWAANYGAVDVPAFVEKYKERTPTLHIKDGTFVSDEPNLPAGQGRMDTLACVSAADQSILEWLIVEFDNCDGDIMDAVAASYRYLISSGLGHGTK